MTSTPLPLDDLQTALATHADAARRQWWERYLKGQARFRGVSTRDIRRLSKAWWDGHDGDTLLPAEQLETCLALLRCPLTEDKLAGMLLLGERLIPAERLDCASAVPRFATLYPAGHLADWNAVDWFCVRVLGPLIERSSEPCARSIAAWVEAEVLWQRRSGLVAWLKDTVLARANISSSDLDLFTVCDDPSEAVDIIDAFYKENMLRPNF